jgi:hypothetical protein
VPKSSAFEYSDSIVGVTRAAFLTALLCLACGRSDHAQPPAFARVNGEAIAVEQPVAGTSQTAAQARADIDRAITRHVAAEEAERRGLAHDSASTPPSVKDEERLRDALFASMRDSATVSDDDLRAHYEQTKLRYAVRQLVLRRRVFPSDAAARAEDRRLGSAGRLPADSEAIGPAPVEKLPGSVLPEALSFSAPGQRAAVQREGRWALVELEEVRAAQPLPFEAVRPQVEQSLRLLRAQAEFSAEIERLRSQAKVEIASP